MRSLPWLWLVNFTTASMIINTSRQTVLLNCEFFSSCSRCHELLVDAGIVQFLS